jgi:hypothetical protein
VILAATELRGNAVRIAEKPEFNEKLVAFNSLSFYYSRLVLSAASKARKGKFDIKEFSETALRITTLL